MFPHCLRGVRCLSGGRNAPVLAEGGLFSLFIHNLCLLCHQALAVPQFCFMSAWNTKPRQKGIKRTVSNDRDSMMVGARFKYTRSLPWDVRENRRKTECLRTRGTQYVWQRTATLSYRCCDFNSLEQLGITKSFLISFPAFRKHSMKARFFFITPELGQGVVAQWFKPIPCITASGVKSCLLCFWSYFLLTFPRGRRMETCLPQWDTHGAPGSHLLTTSRKVVH